MINENENPENPEKDEQLARERFNSSVEGHRKIDSETVKRIGSDKSMIVQKQAEQGKIDIANQRLDRLESVVDRRWNPKIKPWVMGSVALLGALTFSTGFQVIFKKTGSPFATGGAALVASGLMLLVDDRATKYLGNLRSRKDSENTIAAIAQQKNTHKPQTEISAQYYDSQEALVRQVEAEHLTGKNDRMDFYLAIAASTLEAGVAFVVVSASGSLFLALLSAALPVSVIWIAAAFQSDRFEFADHCEALIPAYENYLPASDQVTEEEMLEIRQLDAGVRYLSGNGAGGFKNIAQARFAAEAKFSWERKAHYGKAGVAALRDRHQQHEQDVENLSNKFLTPKVEIADLSPAEQRMQERVIAGQKQDWVDAETIKLEQKLANDIDFLNAKYGQYVNEWKTRALRAEQDMRNAGQDDANNLGDESEAA